MARSIYCGKCGKEKESRESGYCNQCKRERANLKYATEGGKKRLEKRIKDGLPLKRIGRNPLCSKCGKEKEKAYASSGYCRTCKIKRNRQIYVEKRLLGIKAYTRNRLATCYTCGKVKENPTRGYCAFCENEHAKKAYRKRYDTPDAMAENRKSINKKRREKRLADGISFHLKEFAHKIVRMAIKKRILISKPCEICGKEKVDAHHDDYAKPLEVRWLCRFHHNKHHNQSV